VVPKKKHAMPRNMQIGDAKVGTTEGRRKEEDNSGGVSWGTEDPRGKLLHRTVGSIYAFG